MTYAIVFISAGLLAYWAHQSVRLALEDWRERRAAALLDRLTGEVDSDGR